jgi:hypothetical protein
VIKEIQLHGFAVLYSSARFHGVRQTWRNACNRSQMNLSAVGVMCNAIWASLELYTGVRRRKALHLLLTRYQISSPANMHDVTVLTEEIAALLLYTLIAPHTPPPDGTSEANRCTQHSTVANTQRAPLSLSPASFVPISMLSCPTQHCMLEAAGCAVLT